MNMRALIDKRLLCQSISSATDILSFYGQFSTPGLLGNMVYDVIPSVPAAFGNTTVNASVYDLDCSGLAGVNFMETREDLPSNSTQSPTYSIQYKNWTSSDGKMPCTYNESG